MNQPLHNIARGKVRRLLEFLKRFQTLKKPPVRNIDEYSWKLFLERLPRHPAITVGQLAAVGANDEVGVVDGLILRVRRPQPTLCPAPPADLREWILAGWNKLEGEPEFLETRNVVFGEETRTIRFGDDSRRVQSRDEWITRRKAWVVAETPTRQVEHVYQRLYALHGEVERESENVQLVLGDGLIRATDVVGQINHPVLLQRLELQFDPKEPEFRLVETDDPPELAMAVISAIPSQDGQHLANAKQLAKCQSELNENRRIHPLGGDETKGFLARLVNGVFAKGALCETDDEHRATQADVTLRREPLVFLAPRVGSYSTAIDAAIRRIDSSPEFQIPKVLTNLVGEGLESQSGSNSANRAAEVQTGRVLDEVELLLTRPANPEQEQVVRQLDQTGMVLVQGPPGTGKTHTIANLVGHALAQGKTILITSHSAKALRVVREKIVDELRPLCVSVLDTDATSRQELKEAIAAIGQRLGTTTQEVLDGTVVGLSTIRELVSRKLKSAQDALRDAVRDEYVDVIVGGEGVNPAEAARRLHDWNDEHSWLPGSVEAGASLPLSPQEFADLYGTNAILNSSDEQDLACRLPDLDRLPSPEKFEAAVARIKALRQAGVVRDTDLWTETPSSRSEINQLHSRLTAECQRLRSEPAWFRECVEGGFNGEHVVADWIGLVNLIEETCEITAKARSAALARQIHELPPGWILEELFDVSKAIEVHVQNGGGLGTLARLFKPQWARLLDWTFDSRRLKVVDDFGAIAKLTAAELKRGELVKRWQIQLNGLDADLPADASAKPEEFMRQFIPRMRDAVRWFAETGSSLEQAVTKLGIRWQDWVNRQAQLTGPNPTLTRWLNAADALIPVLQRRIEWHELRRCEQQLTELLDYLRSFGLGTQSAPTTQRLLAAVTRGNSHEYAQAIARLRTLQSLIEPNRRRAAALTRLRKAAPTWADTIAHRKAPHDGQVPPGDVQRAWLFRQWSQELDRRASTDIDSLQRDVNTFSEQLRDVTARFVIASTWAEQRRKRYATRLRQSLTGYANTVSSRGFESGVRSAALKAQAREQLKSARAAVPVWIMPLSRVVESFDFSSTLFDIVIIDEASQCDVIGILPLMLASSVFVVGDKEQVSPLAIGEKGLEIQSLIDQFLYDIPSKESYAGSTSIYELAQECFETPTCLVEHFRCVPEIIQFSNDLCYEGRIKPLRESHEVSTRPFLVAHRVLNGIANNKVNQMEANEVASLLVAATEHSEYDEMTMGVISLVGNEQAEVIDTLLRRHLPETEYAARRILCGNAASFQGDERHVMFLSMVDTSDGTPLRKDRQAAMFKQRFNVAASRAQNQLWVVHSLNPDTELQPGDLRLRLIHHAQDPTALTKQFIQANQRAQSEFEKQVIQRLNKHGYRLAAQWAVGAFSIDIVVFGADNRKIAIECDGDRFHANLEDDHRRQLMLERLGWRFIRIRSSRFFRDRDGAMARVFERLEQLEVEPLGAEIRDDVDKPTDTELKQRIVRRAEELRREWKEQERLEAPPPTRRTSRRRGYKAETETAGSAASTPTQDAQRSLFEESAAPSDDTLARTDKGHLPTTGPKSSSDAPVSGELQAPTTTATTSGPEPMPSPRKPTRRSSSQPSPVIASPVAAGAPIPTNTISLTNNHNVRACPKCGRQAKLHEVRLYNGVKKYWKCSGYPKDCNFTEDAKK